MTGSIRFDRAAEYYDRTRALPEDAQAEITDLLVSELAGRGLAVEIGVGTGRMALPLAARGLRVAGLDLSEPMISQLVAKEHGRFPIPLIADATRLPLADGSVGGVFACHVLHLIPRWRAALREVERVLAPAGVLLVDPGGGPGGLWKELADHVLSQLGISRPRPGITDISDVDAELRGRMRARSLPRITARRERSISSALDEIGEQIFAWTWDLEPAALRAAVEGTRRWAAERFRDLDQPREVEVLVSWRAYDFADGEAGD